MSDKYHNITNYIEERGLVYPTEMARLKACDAEDAMVRSLLELKMRVDRLVSKYESGEGWQMLCEMTGAFGPNDHLSPIAARVAMNAATLYALGGLTNEKEVEK